MTGWQLSLLLKPAITLAMAAAYFAVIVLGLRWLYPRLPKNKVVDFLFRERGNRRPDYGPGFSGVRGGAARMPEVQRLLAPAPAAGHKIQSKDLPPA
jgi:hypothetical protein